MIQQEDVLFFKILPKYEAKSGQASPFDINSHLYYNRIDDNVTYLSQDQVEFPQTQIMIFTYNRQNCFLFEIDEEITRMLYGDAILLVGSSGRSLYFNTYEMCLKLVFKDPIVHVGYRGRLIVLTSSGEIYYWIEMNQSRRYQKLNSELPFDSNEERIVDIACGSTMALILTEKGNIYGTGQNNGQLGVKSDSDYHNNWILSSTSHIPEKIKQIYCSYNSSFLLTENGHLYCCGNGYGSNSLVEDVDNYLWTPVPNLENEIVVDMVLGLFYGAIITKSSNIYIFGYFNFKQLGISSLNTETVIRGPKLFDLFTDINCIKELFCAGYNSILLTNDNEVYIAGCLNNQPSGYHLFNWRDFLPDKDIPISTIKVGHTNNDRPVIVLNRRILCSRCFDFRKAWKISDISFRTTDD